jgi:hypothetical protein
MTKNNDPQTETDSSKPHPALQRLNVLIGTWDMKGHTLDSREDNISGWNTFEWLPGGFFIPRMWRAISSLTPIQLRNIPVP